MKRLISILLIFVLLIGCTQRIILPGSYEKEAVLELTLTAQPTAISSPVPATPEPTATPRPALATFSPLPNGEVLFAEEILSQDGEPIASLVRSLLEADGLSKTAFLERFHEIIDRLDELDTNLLTLSNQGRTLTADRKQKTISSLQQLTGK